MSLSGLFCKYVCWVAVALRIVYVYVQIMLACVKWRVVLFAFVYQILQSKYSFMQILVFYRASESVGYRNNRIVTLRDIEVFKSLMLYDIAVIWFKSCFMAESV